MGKAMDEAIAMVSDSSRPERKLHNSRLANACRVRELTINHRYLFVDALVKCGTSVDEIFESFLFIACDNVALNKKHNTQIFHLSSYQMDAIEWVKRLVSPQR